MASITIRKLDEDIKRRLRIRAAEHGRSMEEEAREILQSVLSQRTARLAQAIHGRFKALGGVELAVLPLGRRRHSLEIATDSFQREPEQVPSGPQNEWILRGRLHRGYWVGR